MARYLIAAVALAALCFGQTSTMIGAAEAVRAGAGEIDFKPDTGARILVRILPDTILQRVAPGARDLKNAEAIGLQTIAPGDRLLVTFTAGSAEARRVVVMSASEIGKRNKADRLDWARRGVAGVVAQKSGNEIVLRMRSFAGESQATVIVSGETSFRRYAPDSVKFADARPSSLAEVALGDQLRARGRKSEDGLTVTAGEVVFGTFLTKAGTITAVRAESNEIAVTDIATGKPLAVRITPDSQLKKMPGFPGATAAGGMPRPAGVARGAMPAGPDGSPPVGMREPGMPGGPPGAMPARAGGPPDLSQMVERLPAVRLDELKAGDTIVVSSTKGASSGEVTAIMLLANAEMLVRMAAAQGAGPNPREAMNSGPSGPQMGMQGLDLPGMIP